MGRMARFVLTFSVLLFLPFTAFGQAPRPPIKIGHLSTYSGVSAGPGQNLTRGLELYLAKIGNKAGGRELQLLKEDDEFKPDVGLLKARKLVERDRVDVLVGPVSSGVALAIRDFVHGQGIPQIVPVAFTRDLTAPAMASPWILRIIETSDQSNFNLGTWVFKSTPYRKVAVMGADYAAGRHASGAFMAAFKAAGGEIVKEIYPPLGTPDFAPYVAQLGGLTADAVYAFIVGADAIRFVKTYQDYGLRGKLPIFTHLAMVDDDTLAAMGDSALGIVAVANYTATLDTPETRTFVKDYEARYNTWPHFVAEGGYVAGQLVGAAIEALKGEVSDRAKLRDALKNAATQIRPPRGPIQFDRYQQVITSVYITRVERQGNRLVNAIVDRIPNTSQEETWKWWNK